MEAPSIAVLTPTIPGRSSLLEECAASVRAQTIEVEHLIGLDHERKGPSFVRNGLAGQTDAEWLLPLDDDDLIDHDFIETLSPHLTDDVDIVYPWHHDIDGLCFNRWPNFDLLLRVNFIPVTALIRHSVWDEIGGMPEPPDRAQPGEDWEFFKLCLGAGAVFKCVDEVLWTYRVQSDTRNWQEAALAA